MYGNGAVVIMFYASIVCEIISVLWWRWNAFIFQGDVWSIQDIINKACNMARAFETSVVLYKPVAKTKHLNSNKNIKWVHLN